MNKSRHVTFRCTQEQYAQIKRDAGYCGVGVSQHLVDTYFEAYPLGYESKTQRAMSLSGKEFFKDIDKIVDLDKP